MCIQYILQSCPNWIRFDWKIILLKFTDSTKNSTSFSFVANIQIHIKFFFVWNECVRMRMCVFVYELFFYIFIYIPYRLEWNDWFVALILSLIVCIDVCASLFISLCVRSLVRFFSSSSFFGTYWYCKNELYRHSLLFDRVHVCKIAATIAVVIKKNITNKMACSWLDGRLRCEQIDVKRCNVRLNIPTVRVADGESTTSTAFVWCRLCADEFDELASKFDVTRYRNVGELAPNKSPLSAIRTGHTRNV